MYHIIKSHYHSQSYCDTLISRLWYLYLFPYFCGLSFQHKHMHSCFQLFIQCSYANADSQQSKGNICPLDMQFKTPCFRNLIYNLIKMYIPVYFSAEVSLCYPHWPLHKCVYWGKV